MKDILNYRNVNLGALLLRLAVGSIFLSHGYAKLMGMAGTIGFFQSLGFGVATAYFVALVETIGGLLILLGLFTSIVSPLLVIIMLVAIFKVKGGNFSKAELDIAILAASAAIFLIGPGKYSVKSYFRTKGTGVLTEK